MNPYRLTSSDRSKPKKTLYVEVGYAHWHDMMKRLPDIGTITNLMAFFFHELHERFTKLDPSLDSGQLDALLRTIIRDGLSGAAVAPSNRNPDKPLIGRPTGRTVKDHARGQGSPSDKKGTD